jgi:flagellin-like protein
MRKLFKCRKALSPVVAAIILIAVTVAVSIAVAAWMGALTFTFMKTEELKITSMTFTGSSGVNNNNITLAIKNPGTSKVTVSQAAVNDVTKTMTTGSTLVYDAGATGSITIMMQTTPWVSGNKYKVTLLSATGTTIAAYEAIA